MSIIKVMSAKSYSNKIFKKIRAWENMIFRKGVLINIGLIQTIKSNLLYVQHFVCKIKFYYSVMVMN